MKPFQRLGLPPNVLGGVVVVNPLEAQYFRIAAQFAEGGRPGVTLQAQSPERLLERERVGNGVRGHTPRVRICPQMPDFFRRGFLLRAHTVPPSGNFILSQMWRLWNYGANACPPSRAVGQMSRPFPWVQFYSRMGQNLGQLKTLKINAPKKC